MHIAEDDISYIPARRRVLGRDLNSFVFGANGSVDQ